MNVPLPRRALSPAEFSQEIGVPEKTITQLLRDGRLHGKKVGRRWVIPVAVLDELLSVPKAP